MNRSTTMMYCPCISIYEVPIIPQSNVRGWEKAMLKGHHLNLAGADEGGGGRGGDVECKV